MKAKKMTFARAKKALEKEIIKNLKENHATYKEIGALETAKQISNSILDGCRHLPLDVLRAMLAIVANTTNDYFSETKDLTTKLEESYLENKHLLN